jgi:hypothetical protein
MAGVPLNCIARTIYVIYYAKFVVSLVNPQVAQEWSEFCHSCNLSYEGGQAAAAYETWSYFFVALIYTAVAQMKDVLLI